MSTTTQKPPQRVEPTTPSDNPATFIFLHGYDDDSESWINIAHQFQSASKLPFLAWIFPNAPFNHEARATAWFTPSSFSPIPVPASVPRDDEDAVDAKEREEIMASVEYINSLIKEEVEKGVKRERIVVGGFSQGCAVALLVGLGWMGRVKDNEKKGGEIVGVVGLSGYLPSVKIEDRKVDERKLNIFLGHGTKDMLVPMRIFRETKKRLVDLVDEERLEAYEYDGLGHVASGTEFRDMCVFLEKILQG